MRCTNQLIEINTFPNSFILSSTSRILKARKICREKYELMSYLWKSIANFNFSRFELKYIFNDLYPYSKMKQKVFFYDPDKEVDEYNGRGIYGTDEMQKLLYEHQFPKSCSDRKFIVIYKFSRVGCGLGSMLHITGQYIAQGMKENRTVIYYPGEYSLFSSSDKCQNQSGLDCFHIPISNCTFTAEEVESDHKRFKKKNLYKAKVKKLPEPIIKILEKSAVPKDLYVFYYRIQSLYFLFHLTDKMKGWVQKFKNESLVNPKKRYDVSIHVRHGDKGREMKLVDTEEYLYPLEILSKYLGRKISVFVSSDEQFSVAYFLNLNSSKYEFSYFNYQRPDAGYIIHNLRDGFTNSIQSYANLIESYNANYIIGTLGSNWNRLILELRLMYLPSMDLPFFEVGDMKCITPYHCKHIGEKLDFYW